MSKNNRNIFIAMAIIIFVGFLTYGNTMKNEMFWDDYNGIVNNQYIQSWKYFPKYFSESLISGSGNVNNYWRPVILLSLSVDYKIGKLKPFVYHLQNLFWHILAGVLILLLARQLSINIFWGTLIALLFLVHPVQTEAVAYISGRADPMHLSFMLAGLFCFIKSIRKVFSVKYYIGAIFFFVLALLTKERAIMFTPLLMLYLVTLYQPEALNTWRKKITILVPFFVISLVYVLLRVTILHFSSNTYEMNVNDFQALTFFQSIILYIKVFVAYLSLIIWPVNLHMIRGINIPTKLLSIDVVIGIFLIGTIMFSFVKLWKKQKMFIFGIGWFLLFLVPDLYTIKMHGFWTEHWLYPALPGLFIVVGFYGEKYFRKLTRRYFLYSGYVVIIVLLMVLSIKTIDRNHEWLEPISFYQQNITRGGQSAIIYNNLGMSYAKEGEYDRAIKMYNMAINTNDKMPQAWYNMGNIYCIRKNYDKALDFYQKAIEREPQFFSAYKNSAVVYVEEGDYDKATEIIKQFLKRYPDNITALFYVAGIYHQQGNIKMANEYIKKVLVVNPNNQLAKDLIKR